MLLTRIYLRNFRVYEDELDLELPPGLVGIYGPNGAGKSTLLEAILFTLWGRARTPKEQIRSAGVGGDCVTEVEFEHEGHLYVVRRTLTGINAAPRAQATCDGLGMSEGVRDTARYVHSVLGMDDAAFRASVFAEQKQLAAFSGQTPAERRRLVLQLLGITPLDGARDAARKDARARSEQHRQLRQMLPDVEVLVVAAADADARAGALETQADEEDRAVSLLVARAEQADRTFDQLDEVRQTYDGLVIEGRAARAECDGATALVARLREELVGLDEAVAELGRLEEAASGRETDEEQLRLLTTVADAAAALDAVVVPPEPGPADEEAHAAAVAAAEDARAGLSTVEGTWQAVTGELERAREQADRSSSLSGSGDCPLCGQALGDAFAQVQAHRAAEVADAEARVAAVSREREERRTAATAAVGRLQDVTAALQQAQQARRVWEQAASRRADASAALAGARSGLGAVAPALVRAGGPAAPDTPPAALRRLVTDRAAAVRVKRDAEGAAERIRGRLEQRPDTVKELQEAEARSAGAAGELTALRDKVAALHFDPAALAAAKADQQEAAQAADAGRRRAQDARIRAAQERARAEGAAERVVDARAQHEKLATLETDSRHLARLADLLADFRNTVVATVGPRLAVQAAALFADLTDHEYDELQVDADTFGLQISDAGRSYGLDRFSGSEIDLANLALRVAISEHIRFQSGGSVGLLVLDEVFGPLDDERKTRMLQALERLRGRFRQVLVVTHDPAIKEQLPHAVEVVKRPGRRATARLLPA